MSGQIRKEHGSKRIDGQLAQLVQHRSGQRWCTSMPCRAMPCYAMVAGWGGSDNNDDGEVVVVVVVRSIAGIIGLCWVPKANTRSRDRITLTAHAL